MKCGNCNLDHDEAVDRLAVEMAEGRVTNRAEAMTFIDQMFDEAIQGELPEFQPNDLTPEDLIRQQIAEDLRNAADEVENDNPKAVTPFLVEALKGIAKLGGLLPI